MALNVKGPFSLVPGRLHGPLGRELGFLFVFLYLCLETIAPG